MIIINITSFIGITSGAKHVYAKYSNTSGKQDVEERAYLESSARKGYYCHTDNELKRFPSRQEAKSLVSNSIYIDDIVKNGTIRFDTLSQVECEINKLFTNEETVWYYCGSIKMFEKVKGRL